MEIEILTTKKKLSKSLVKQMKPASRGDMDFFLTMPTCGYFIRAIDKKLGDVVVFKSANDWCVIRAMGWTASLNDKRAYAKIGKGSTMKEFESKEFRDGWLKAYNETKKQCMKNHLYI